MTDADLEARLLESLRRDRSALQETLGTMSDHWGYEDSFYRFYHHSFKVYHVQTATLTAVQQLQALLPDRPLNAMFARIISEGTDEVFEPAHNREWERHTRPILEAFCHARFMVEMAVRYGTLEEAPRPLPSGYAALLYLFDLR
jgi:hypothetical protein